MRPSAQTLIIRARIDTAQNASRWPGLNDRRVPIRTKLIALGIGAAAIGAIEVLQLPVEGIFAVLLPFVGAAGDLALDGAEAIIGPVLISTLVLPHIAPADIVRQIQAERARGQARS